MSEQIPSTSRFGQMKNRLAQAATRHLLAYQQEYLQELDAQYPSQQETGLHTLRARYLARRAMRGASQAIIDQAIGIRPEKGADVNRAKRTVDAALSDPAVVPYWSGYKQDTLSPHKDITLQINTAAMGVLRPDLDIISDNQFDVIKKMIPRGKLQFTTVSNVSEMVTDPQHVETVRNLLVAYGNEQSERVVSYRYVGVGRSTLGRQESTSQLPAENYLVGFNAATAKTEPQPVALLSLAESSLELLAISDATIRLEPGQELPESSISALTRVYDLVASDSARQYAA